MPLVQAIVRGLMALKPRFSAALGKVEFFFRLTSFARFTVPFTCIELCDGESKYTIR